MAPFRPSTRPRLLWIKESYSRGSRDRSAGGGSGGGKSVGTVVFNNPQSATYAKEKLHGFEYPIGHRLIIKYEEVMPPPPTHQANHLGMFLFIVGV